MIRQIALVALGSAIGGIARYLAGRGIYAAFPMKFPLPTLLVNILGCFLIGLFYAYPADQRWMSNEMRLLLTTGLCGGFTTFSAFSYENIVLMKNGAYSMTLVYVTASVVLGILATWLGMSLVRNS